MTRDEAFKEINDLQDGYINELSQLMDDPNYSSIKAINFTSATGTGKTKMMSKLINKYPNYYFIITTLSKGQLHWQIRDSLEKDCKQNNFTVYGSADYKINSKLDAKDIISKIPPNTKCIWLRDEGHIRTNRFDELLIKHCDKIINFSATNTYNDIQCNFAQTMMLRTVNQTNGKPDDAINKLLEVKEAHKSVNAYNPCAIFRCVSGDNKLHNRITRLCNKYHLKYIDITEDDFLMSELCKDDNEYDVIINKFKIVEGIDIRRAHVLYMDNQPSNNATTIQAIGRCRRNALLYRNDIDILAPENENLLKHTRECYVYYNVEQMKINADSDGELRYAFCNYISCEDLKVNTRIEVVEGQLPNGLYVIELGNLTGTFDVVQDSDTGFNMVVPTTSGFYDTVVEHCDNNYFIFEDGKVHINNISNFPVKTQSWSFDNDGSRVLQDVPPYYEIRRYVSEYNVPYNFDEKVKTALNRYKTLLTKDYIISLIDAKCLDHLRPVAYDLPQMQEYINIFLQNHKDTKGYKQFCRMISCFNKYRITLSGFWYNIEDVCSESELVILKYVCIKRKEHGISDNDNNDYINKYIKLRNYWFLDKHRKDRQLTTIFSDVSLKGLSWKNVVDEVTNFINKSIESGKDKQFINILNYIKDGSSSQNADDVYYQLRRALSKQYLDTVQYCCIQEKKRGVNNSVIENHLHNLVEYLHDFHLIKDVDFDFIAFNLTQQDFSCFASECSVKPFTVNAKHSVDVTANDITVYFERIIDELKTIKEKDTMYVSSSMIVDAIMDSIEFIEQDISDCKISYVKFDYNEFFEDLTSTDMALLNHGVYHYSWSELPLDYVQPKHYRIPYDKVVNDKESSIIGVDLMRQIKTDNNEIIWTESRSVSSKVGNYNKFNAFLSNKYCDELLEASSQYVRGKNNFKLDKKCNSVIGYCVEYYSKYLIYGEEYLQSYIRKAQRESQTDIVNDGIIIRACMLKYKENMIRCFGSGMSKIIRGISASQLIKEQYSYFVSLVVDLGIKTAKFVKASLYSSRDAINNIDDNLTIRHIAGLADYITEDTILDIKVRNNIDEDCIRQVLAYHYLSTKRTDLHIKRVIVYDAVSDKSVTVNITDKNLIKG